MITPANEPAALNGRRPQLDGLRAFAVLLVIWQHTMRPQQLLTRDAGAVGVVLFFVLSGFLISGILLDARDAADQSGASRRGVWGRFYMRRFLRIFPLYYAVVLGAWALGQPEVRQYFWWLVTYRTNFLMAGLGRNIGMPTPFWSLAVEEQFYLFWPLVVLYLPRRRLPWFLIGMIGLSLASRTLTARAGVPEHTITMPTWAALDGLALGGLLAWWQRSGQNYQRVLSWLLASGVGLAAFRLALMALQRGRPIQMGLWVFPFALIGVWLVDRASQGRLPAAFQHRALAWIGVVSYGTYVYHRPLMTVFSIGARRGWDVFTVIALVTIAIASISWLLFERPINDLKRFWPYVRPLRAPMLHLQHTESEGAR